MVAEALLNRLVQYKAVANGDLLDALAELDGETPAYQAALRVLNHAHIVDRIFRAHLQRTGHAYEKSWSAETPPLARLSADMRETDRWYVDYVAPLSPEELEAVIGFTFTDGAPGRMSREEMVAHVVTHAGYHRGEVGRLLPEIEATASRDVFAGYLHRFEPARRAA